MWKVFPKLGILKLLLYIFSALFLAVLILIFEPKEGGAALTWKHFSLALELAAPVTLTFLALIYLVGKWLWVILWKLPLLGKIMHKSVCPNLNGKWKGSIQSNYLDQNGNAISKDVELMIKADLFGFEVHLRSLDGYQDSKVVQSEIYKDPRTGVFYLSYIYEASVPIPEETDDRMFEGAAKLEVVIREDSTALRGTYWTNRAWQRRKNTAGVITISRVNS